MLEISKREYPYPVLALGRDDYSSDCSYSLAINENEIRVSGDYIEIPVAYKLVCPTIEKDIDEQRCISIVKIKSSITSYCRIYRFEAKQREGLIKIPKYGVSEKIELTGLIVANIANKQFSCTEMNETYFNGMFFSINKGDTLAIDTTKIIYIDDTELEKPIASIFTINSLKEQKENINVSFDDSKIQINLNEELSKMYWTLKDCNNGSLRRYVMAIIVTPALIEGITKVIQHYQDEAENDYSQYRWFRAIELKAEQKGYKLNEGDVSPVFLSDILLGGISLDALKSFKDMVDSEMNSGETFQIGGID